MSLRTPRLVGALFPLLVIVVSPTTGLGAPRFDPRGPWCAKGMSRTADNVCYSIPATYSEPRTLIIALHGALHPTQGSPWGVQTAAASVANRHGYASISPRGRPGIGPKGMRDYVTWPTSRVAQKGHLRSVLGEWERAKRSLERKGGKPFERVFVLGFSNGAYFLTGLAMTKTLPATGWAAFAGGAAPGPTVVTTTQMRATPFFVGVGERDVARADPASLGRFLFDRAWTSRTVSYPEHGHSMTESQMDEAVQYLARVADARAAVGTRSR